jgi:hypothetical protein
MEIKKHLAKESGLRPPKINWLTRYHVKGWWWPLMNAKPREDAYAGGFTVSIHPACSLSSDTPLRSCEVSRVPCS